MEVRSDLVGEGEMPDYQKIGRAERPLRVLSLFSGCGGMDLGMEGGFIAPRKSFVEGSGAVARVINEDWVLVRKTRMETVFANDILPEAYATWAAYMSRFGRGAETYRRESVVDLVKRAKVGERVFPEGVDIVTGGFPCQDFSVAGKRLGFESRRRHDGKARGEDEPTEETRGKLYYWMKQVIDLTRPKVFVAENVKGLVSLGDVKEIIQRDFASADGGGYIVLTPRVLHAADYGVAENRERVIFIGLRRDALRGEALSALEGGESGGEYDPYPRATHGYTRSGEGLLEPLTTWDVLHGLREPGESVDAAQNTYSRAKYLGHGQGQTEIRLDGIGPTIRSEHHGNIEYRRLSAEHGGRHAAELVRGLAERRLTPRECGLIQTFPPDFPLVGGGLSASGAYKVVGNAVPPVLAYRIGERLEEVWERWFE